MMWSSKICVPRRAILLCHKCRHQTQGSGQSNVHTVVPAGVTSNHLRHSVQRPANVACSRHVLALTWGKIDGQTFTNSAGHVTGKHIDSIWKGIDTSGPNAPINVCRSSHVRRTKLLQMQNAQRSVSSLSNSEDNSNRNVFETCDIKNQKSCISHIERSKNETHTKLTACDSELNHLRLSNDCSFTPSYSSMHTSRLKTNLAHNGYSVLLNIKRNKLSCSRARFFHTSVKKKSTHGGVTIRQKPPWRILFFGTDSIALHTLKELYRNMTERGSLVESLEVVTAVKKQRHVRAFAESVDLKIHDWPLAIETEKYDVGVLVSFGHLIPESVIHMFPYGILNMHPSLLPRWRGASPIIHTLLNGDDVTGVSIMEIRPKHFDIGPLLLQRECNIPHRCTSTQLTEVLGRFGSSMVLECLKDLPTLERLEHEQDSRGITYAHKLGYKNANVDWENSTAEQIDCQWRAISDLITLKTEFDGHVTKLLDVVDPMLLKDTRSIDIRGYEGDINHAEPGTVAYHKHQKCIVVKCKEGIIGFRNVVIRKHLTASDFFNGYINRNICKRFISLENDLNKYTRLERMPIKSAV